MGSHWWGSGLGRVGIELVGAWGHGRGEGQSTMGGDLQPYHVEMSLERLGLCNANLWGRPRAWLVSGKWVEGHLAPYFYFSGSCSPHPELAARQRPRDVSG